MMTQAELSNKRMAKVLHRRALKQGRDTAAPSRALSKRRWKAEQTELIRAQQAQAKAEQQEATKQAIRTRTTSLMAKVGNKVKNALSFFRRTP